MSDTISSTHDEPTVFVVDDDHDVCHAIAMLLQSVGLRSEIYTDPVEFLDSFDSERAGCVLLDVRMPRLSGIDLHARLVERDVSTPVIFISGHGDIPMALRAVRSGAIDFLEKPFGDQVLIDSVNEAIALDTRRRSAAADRAGAKARIDALSAREREVSLKVADGLSAREIGVQLGLSPRTVEMHRVHAMRRLGVHTATELTRIVVEAKAQGLLD
jgi:FixJ family two-component response regulator